MCFRNRLGAKEKRNRYWNLHRSSNLNEVFGFKTAECGLMNVCKYMKNKDIYYLVFAAPVLMWLNYSIPLDIENTDTWNIKFNA
jgi:hypothetical protein